MTSTFHGLETARRAMSTHQTALQTTGHNIANANTPGYSRQRVNFKSTEAFPSPAFNKPMIPGQIGTGVKAGEVERVRQAFLDVQFREENNQNGYWNSRYSALEKMEDILNEPTEDGIANTMDRFWQSLQDLSVHPEDSGARSVVRQRGIALAEKFNYTYDSLETIQKDYKSELGVQTDRINSLTDQINSINKQIAAVEPHGFLSNDLYDQRDMLVDELSNYVNIKVDQVGSGGLAKDTAAGRYTIKLLDNNGHDMGYTLVDGSKLSSNELKLQFDEADDGSKLVQGVKIGNHSMDIEDFSSPGELRASIEAYGYVNGDGEKMGLFPEMQQQLDVMVSTFVDEFNKVHQEGWSLSEIEAGEKANGGAGFKFFTYDEGEDASAAKTLQVHDDINSSLDNIAASSTVEGKYVTMSRVEGDGDIPDPSISGKYTGNNPQDLYVRYIQDEDGEGEWMYQLVPLNGEPVEDDEDNGGNWDPIEDDEINGLTINLSDIDPSETTTWHLSNLQPDQAPSAPPEHSFSGDGSNALALANIKDKELSFGEDSTTNVQSFYQGIIGDMAVSTNEADRMMRNTETLRDSVEDRRQSVSGVSLDEEMSDMIKFQHAYNAAARNITMIDEMLERIINGMGVVGR